MLLGQFKGAGRGDPPGPAGQDNHIVFIQIRRLVRDFPVHKIRDIAEIPIQTHF